MSKKKEVEWTKVHGSWISKRPVLPGVWLHKEGGHAVRTRVRLEATGRRKEIWRVLPNVDAATALKWLTEERARVEAGAVSLPKSSVRFSEFASSLMERKIANKEILSAKGRQKWADILEHLIGGTEGKSGRHVDGFGDYLIDKLTTVHVETWKSRVADLIAAGDYAPTTVNGWLSVLRVIMKAAKREHQLTQLATEHIDNFDVSEHETYSDEEPNALLPSEVGPFLERLRETHPHHYAMVFLGLVTGLRPSSLRPIRRTGTESDVVWDEGRLRVRRSHTVGDEVMRTTKQKQKYVIDLPPEAMAVLRWHVDTQLVTPEQQESPLLFPSITGGFRAPCVLNKPLEEVAEELKLGKNLTQRGLRRTFNDLARAARVDDLVTRSISGHMTETMQHHYSTVSGAEQRRAVAQVIQLFARRDAAEDEVAVTKVNQ